MLLAFCAFNIMSQLRSSSGFYVATLLGFLSIAQSTLIEQNITYIYLINASLELSSLLDAFIMIHSNIHFFLKFSFSLFLLDSNILFDGCMYCLTLPHLTLKITKKMNFFVPFKKQKTSSSMHTNTKVTYL